jgi:hypothetical protein
MMESSSEYRFANYTPNEQDRISLIFTKCQEELVEAKRLREVSIKYTIFKKYCHISSTFKLYV